MSDSMTYLAIAAAVALIALNLLAIISVFKSERSVGAKALWAIGIALFPVLGLLFWLLVGVRRPLIRVSDPAGTALVPIPAPNRRACRPDATAHLRHAVRAPAAG